MSYQSSLAAIRESFGRVVYSHKTHEKAIERLYRRDSRVKWTNVVLIGFTFSGVLNALLAGGFYLNLTTAIVSGVSLALAVYRLSFDPQDQIVRQRKTADQLRQLREEYANLLADIDDGALSSDDVRRRRDKLTGRLGRAYDDAPPTTSTDYREAQKSLNPGEEMTFSEQEIDRFLPSTSDDK